jgi:hypothetical protein
MLRLPAAVSKKSQAGNRASTRNEQLMVVTRSNRTRMRRSNIICADALNVVCDPINLKGFPNPLSLGNQKPPGTAIVHLAQESGEYDDG